MIFAPHTVPAELKARQVAADISKDSFRALPTIYLPAEDVAGVCGLPLALLHAHYRPKDWVRGLQWVEIADVIFYREGSICEFCGVLATSEKLDAAQRLMTWLVSRGDCTVEFTAGSSGAMRKSDAGSAIGIAATPARPNGWLDRWERKQEEISR